MLIAKDDINNGRPCGVASYLLIIVAWNRGAGRGVDGIKHRTIAGVSHRVDGGKFSGICDGRKTQSHKERKKENNGGKQESCHDEKSRQER